jgi:signal peptidase I
MADDMTTAHDKSAAANTAPAGDLGARPMKKKESWLEVAKTIIYALLIAGVIRSFLFQPFNIPSGSMEDTLLIGDYLFVSKAAYGYSRYSFPFGIIPFQGRFFASAPKRGDVVVFKFPGDNSTDYIKRLIGLPGDRIQMKDGVLYINEKAVPKERAGDAMINDYGGQPRPVPKYRETLPNGVSYYVLDQQPDGDLDNTQVYVVPEGHYFMMGDNRDNSADSRANVGFVPFENFVGKAEIIFFSKDDSARIWELWKLPLAIRYDRIAEFVH